MKVMIDKIHNIVKDYDFLHDEAEEIEKMKSEYDEYKAKVLLIGDFSVGKSSLINTFLKEKLLEIDIEPTTAKPQEIFYSEKRKIEDIGQKKLFYLDNPKLKKFQNLCIVDLPGLSSAIKQHDDILSDYIKQTAFFIIVLDTEYGLSKDLLDFLFRIRDYIEYYAIIVNKYDKKREDIQKIIEYNVKVLKEKLGKEPTHYGKTSVFDEDVYDFEIALEKFSKEAGNLRNIVFSKDLILIVQNSIRSLEIMKAQLESDISIEEIDEMIRKLEKDRENIEKYYHEQKEKIEQSMKTNIENVSKLIEIKIKNNASYLAKLSQDEFEIEIQKIIDSEISQLASMEDEVRDLIRALNA
ncbi:MAG: dynamin family protein, partial [candidate division WOR-3 bacterium]|nr:dynamin family protein [candidate division WOR-3 bacterium]MDW8151297.1 dynamin family protein [candidate division WOR-3 bacterium]